MQCWGASRNVVENHWPTPSLYRATILFFRSSESSLPWSAMLNIQWPVWESECDNTKFNTPAPYSHQRVTWHWERKWLIGPFLLRGVLTFVASGLDINGFTELFWGDSKFALLYKLYTLPGHGLLVCPWQTFVRQLAGPRRPHLPGSITWMFRPCRPGFYLLKVAHTYLGGLFLRQGLILQEALGAITQVISCAVQIVISSVLSHENI